MNTRSTPGRSLGQRVDMLSTALGEQGFSVAAVDRLAERLALSHDQLAWVTGMSTRTLARRRRDGRLGVAESDRLYRLFCLFERAAETFAGPDGKDADAEVDARRWLHLPQWALGGATPLSFSDTELGLGEVEALIDRIDSGVLA